MPFRRHLGASPFARLLARLLIVALVVGSVPSVASASYSASYERAANIAAPGALAAPAETRRIVAVLVLVPLTDCGRTLVLGYIHADGLGSIRRLTNEAGNITDGYTYSAFGELLAHTGSDPQPYAFAGEPLDPNVGFQYHRARWMDPRTGRFVGMDSYEGNEYDPPSLHKYLYVFANPVNRVDPSGYEGEGGLTGTLVSITISISINAISTFNPNAPIASLATAVLTGTAEGLIPLEVPEKILSFAWRFARPVAGGIWKFGSRALVGLESPIAEYGFLQLFTAGKAGAIQAHHILEQRFLKLWGYSITEAPAQILTKAEHEEITQKLLKALPAGYKYTKDQVWKVYQEVYAYAPGYLLAIEKYFR